MSKLFQKPESIFQADVNDIMKTDPEANLIKDLISLQMFKDAEKDDKYLVLSELHRYLGTEKFMGVMDILAGKTLKFPEKDSFKETIQIALCWYYRQYRNYSWDEIKVLLNDEDLQTVKLGIKLNNLQKFINHYEDIKNARRSRNN